MRAGGGFRSKGILEGKSVSAQSGRRQWVQRPRGLNRMFCVVRQLNGARSREATWIGQCQRSSTGAKKVLGVLDLSLGQGNREPRWSSKQGGTRSYECVRGTSLAAVWRMG